MHGAHAGLIPGFRRAEPTLRIGDPRVGHARLGANLLGSTKIWCAKSGSTLHGAHTVPDRRRIVDTSREGD